MLFFISLAFYSLTLREGDREAAAAGDGQQRSGGEATAERGACVSGPRRAFIVQQIRETGGGIPGAGAVRRVSACLPGVRLAAAPSGAAVCFPSRPFFSCAFPCGRCLRFSSVFAVGVACRGWWWRWWWGCPLLYIIFIPFFVFILYTRRCCFLRCGLLCLPARRLLCWAAVCVARSSAKTKK